MDRLGAIGFESKALATCGAALGTVDEEVDAVARVSRLGPPPVLVAHGLGAFVAQKYLESYSACGLVLIAPFPPDPAGALSRLDKRSLLPRTGLAEKHWSNDIDLEPDPSALISDASRAEQILTLEPAGHFLPVLVVSTEQDPVVQRRDISALAAFHDLNGNDEVVRPGDKGHMTMADPSWECPGGMSDEVVRWFSDKF